MRDRIFKMGMMGVMGVMLFAGCATPKMGTPSGRPEVTIQAPADKTRSFLLNHFANRGFTPRQADGSILVLEKNAGTAADIFFGSRFNPETKARMKLTLIENGDATRVLYAGYIVSNPGSGLENENEVWGDWKKVQAMLEGLKGQIEAGQ